MDAVAPARLRGNGADNREFRHNVHTTRRGHSGLVDGRGCAHRAPGAEAGPSADGEVVWSRRPGFWRQGLRRCGGQPARASAIRKATGAIVQRSPRRARRTPLKPFAQGRPGVRLTCGPPRVHLFAHGLAGAAGARPSLRPCLSRGQRMKHSSGEDAARPRRCACDLEVQLMALRKLLILVIASANPDRHPEVRAQRRTAPLSEPRRATARLSQHGRPSFEARCTVLRIVQLTPQDDGTNYPPHGIAPPPA